MQDIIFNDTSDNQKTQNLFPKLVQFQPLNTKKTRKKKKKQKQIEN